MTAADRSASFRRARALFDEWVELPPDERASRLERLASREPELAREVAELLAADSAADDFLEQGAAEHAALLVEAAAPEPERTGEWVGPYQLFELLGRGGMGEVYRAQRSDGQFEQDVAVKILRPGMDSAEFERRFLRERQILARLVHPNIARLLDGGLTAAGRPYFVMERVDGEPIDVACRRLGAPLEARIRFLADACDAVAEAHRNLVVHRDLKPSNVLLDRSGEVKLLDFGIAKLLHPEAGDLALTRLDERVLTPAYAAPEQILGGPVTTAADVYSLGVLLFQLLTGAMPHERGGDETPAQLVSRVATEEVPRASSLIRKFEELPAQAPPLERGRLARRLAGDLDRILMKALHREAERRYRSASELGRDLRRFLEGRPVTARPDGMVYRARKFVGRHWVGVAAATVALLALVVGLTLALWQAGVAREAARRADSEARRAEIETARAERVKNFVVGLFQQADPLRRQFGREANVRDLLTVGLTRAEQELASDPEVLELLWADFINIWSNLGDRNTALDLSERLYERRRVRLGADHPDLAKDLVRLQFQRMDAGDLEAAEQALTEARALLDAHPDIAPAVVMEWKQAFVVQRMRQGRVREALPVAQEVSAHADRTEGDSQGALMMRQNLASLLAAAGQAAQAEAAFASTLAGLEKLHGPEHLSLAYVRLSLAEAQSIQGHFEGAEASLAAAVPVLEREVGTGHPMFRYALYLQGDVAQAKGDWAAAERWQRHLLEVGRDLGAAGTDAARASLGWTLVETGRLAAGLAELAPGVESLRARKSTLVDRPTAWLGVALARAGRLDEARASLRGLLAELEAAPEGDGSAQFEALLRLAEAERLAGQGAVAADLARRARAKAAEVFGPAHPAHAAAAAELARALASSSP
ncbi:MAG: protein kinase [Thermoanaerobaculia bacterium]|nr:protein kinase [Thermoanaerobaculia bacterium]